MMGIEAVPFIPTRPSPTSRTQSADRDSTEAATRSRHVPSCLAFPLCRQLGGSVALRTSLARCPSFRFRDHGRHRRAMDFSP